VGWHRSLESRADRCHYLSSGVENRAAHAPSITELTIVERVTARPSVIKVANQVACNGERVRRRLGPVGADEPLNFGGWNDPKTDELIARERQALDRNERKGYIDELSKYFMTEAHPQAFVPTMHGYVWWRKPYQNVPELLPVSYTGFFGQFSWLDPVPGNMKSFSSF
jgi:ABC-type transport system substrate-binding protein